MKKNKAMPIILSLFIFLLGVCTFVNAQKLPKVQEHSVRAPINIKIDGILNEWNNVFYAKNTNDDINYTISNDKDMLYLTIRALNALSSSKMVNGGVTFIISHSIDKKQREKDAKNISITFPLVSRAQAASINQKHNYGSTLVDNIHSKKKEIDSLYDVTTKQTSAAFKELEISELKKIDTLSIYNANGIKVAAGFDKTFLYNYELAIPLKNLGLSYATPFSYCIKLAPPPKPNPNAVSVGDDGRIAKAAPPGYFGKFDVQPSVPTADGAFLMSTTSFWGEYTLAK